MRIFVFEKGKWRDVNPKRRTINREMPKVSVQLYQSDFDNSYVIGGTCYHCQKISLVFESKTGFVMCRNCYAELPKKRRHKDKPKKTVKTKDWWELNIKMLII